MCATERQFWDAFFTQGYVCLLYPFILGEGVNMTAYEGTHTWWSNRKGPKTLDGMRESLQDLEGSRFHRWLIV